MIRIVILKNKYRLGYFSPKSFELIEQKNDYFYTTDYIIKVSNKTWYS